jgi:HAD superfamily hydrolase (TIGR01509 family)
MLLDDPGGLADRYKLDKKEVEAFGLKAWEEFAYIRAETADEIRDLEEDYWERFIRRFSLPGRVGTFLEITPDFIREVEGMVSLLEEKHALGVPMAICSNNNPFWLKRQVETLALDRFFPPERIISSSDIGFPKSAPGFRMFRAACRSVRTKPEECLFIEDRFENIEKSMAFGMPGILFPRESPGGARYLQNLLDSLMDDSG